jgi:hypothetical protein
MYERSKNIFPKNPIDSTLKESLISGHSPVRKYVRSKYAFDQAALTPFIKLKNSDLTEMHTNEQVFNRVLD